jgi:hypothetical protein
MEKEPSDFVIAPPERPCNWIEVFCNGLFVFSYFTGDNKYILTIGRKGNTCRNNNNSNYLKKGMIDKRNFA